MSELLTFFQSHQQAMTDYLTKLVSYETPTLDKPAVEALGAFMESEFKQMGAAVTRYPQEKVGDFLLAKWNADAPGKPIMFLIHIDTVWPIGTLAEADRDTGRAPDPHRRGRQTLWPRRD